jgi:hypothetical protein
MRKKRQTQTLRLFHFKRHLSTVNSYEEQADRIEDRERNCINVNRESVAVALACGNHSEGDLELVRNRVGPVARGYHRSHCIYRVRSFVQQLVRSTTRVRHLLRELIALVMLNVILNSMPMTIV